MYQRNNSSVSAPSSVNKVQSNQMNYYNAPTAEFSETPNETGIIPRVTASMLPSFCNQTVALFGRAIGVDHDNWKVHVQCPLSGETLILPVQRSGAQNDELQFSVHNEFILKIGASPKNLVLVDHSSLTDNFDYDSYKYLMQLMWGHCAYLFH
ncbi:cytochrome C oxidase copper chaperone [Perkinsela sp. CCAP 1560/4]|nr:cytochrome C oxidase copper chaperone [Perkinsela sp. CCAP 1560/4]|eukprot:KNH09276.1 cytochrome C oxidase copper chaperone [Perkinsela sp. CCAP 1560/4]